MNTVSKRILELTESAPAKIKNIPENVLDKKPAQDKWSKKEILGHLCDSALNNISRVIRSQYDRLPLPVVSYHQMEWVNLNGYQNMLVEEIINLWVMLNRRLAHIISAVPGGGLNNLCVLSDGEKISIGGLMEEDYLKHMKYHLNQILAK